MSETLDHVASSARTDAPPAILLDKVNKWYGALHVLRDVSLTWRWASAWWSAAPRARASPP